MSAIEAEIDLQLTVGSHESVIPRVAAYQSEDPYRERLWRQLMLALYRSGRQADALKASDGRGGAWSAISVSIHRWNFGRSRNRS